MSTLQEQVDALRGAGFSDDEVAAFVEQNASVATSSTPTSTGSRPPALYPPQHTPEEWGQGIETRRKLEDAAMIIGPSIIGSMIAPQFALPSGVAKLGLLTKLGNLALRSGGAAAGAGGGSAATDVMRGEPIDPEKAGQEALLGAAGEVGGVAVEAVAKPVLRFAGKNVVKPALRFLSRNTEAGQMVQRHFQRKIMDQTNKWAVDFVDNMGLPRVTAEETGRALGAPMQAMMDAAKSEYAPFQAAMQSAAKREGGFLYLDNTMQVLGEQVEKYIAHVMKRKAAVANVLRDYGYKATSKPANLLRNLMAGEEGKITPGDLDDLFKTIYTGYDPTSYSTQMKARELLKETIKGDIDRLGAGAELKETADAAWRKMKTFFGETKNVRGNKAAEQIIKRTKDGPLWESHPEYVIDNILKNAEGPDIVELKDIILTSQDGAQIWAGLEYGVAERLFNSAIKKTEDSGAKKFLPTAFADEVDALAPKLKEAMPGLWKQLEAAAQQARQVAPHFEKQTATQIGGRFGVQTMMGYAGGPVYGIAVPNAFGALAAWGMLSPAGKKALGAVYRAGMKAGEVTAKEGTRAGIVLGGQPVRMGGGNGRE